MALVTSSAIERALLVHVVPSSVSIDRTVVRSVSRSVLFPALDMIARHNFQHLGQRHLVSSIS